MRLEEKTEDVVFVPQCNMGQHEETQNESVRENRTFLIMEGPESVTGNNVRKRKRDDEIIGSNYDLNHAEQKSLKNPVEKR